MTTSKDAKVSKDVEKVVEPVDEETEYPSWKRVALIMMAIYISIFLIALDKLIIITAIPEITNTFSSLNDIGWYGSAYMLTLCSFQLFWGKLYKLATTKSLPLPLSSAKTVFLLAITVFEIGSAICGASPSSPAFIIGRSIAGLGASGIMNGSIVIMFSILPLRKRPVYQGFVGAMFGIASIVGPLLGGVFTQKVSWRWCFYINLPLGGLAMAVLIVVLPGKKTVEKASENSTADNTTALTQLMMFDPAGTLFFIVSIICLLLALQWGGATYAWSSWRIILLLVLFPVLLIAFFAIQVRYPKYATLPLRILKQRSVACAFWYMWWVQSAMLVIAYYIPLFFQAIKDFTPLDSGLATLPLLLSLVISSIMAGGLVQRFGVPAPLMLVSVTLATIGAGMISTWPVNVKSSEWIGYQVILGFGIGIGMQMPSLIVQIVLPKPDQSTGVALMFLAQNAGGAVFLSVAQNVFTDQLAKNIQGIPGLDIGKAAIAKLGATEIKNLVSKGLLPTLLEGYRLAIRNLFWMGTGLVALAIIGAALVEWRSLKDPEKDSKDGAEVEKKKTESSV